MIAAVYLYQQVDEGIRCWVENKFTQCYAGLKVTVRSAELIEGEGIEIRGLSIVEPGAKGPRAELLHLEEVFLSCPAGLKELVSGTPEIDDVLVRRPTLRLTRRPDGTWSASRLLSQPKLGDQRPPVRIENGTIEIFDPLRNPSSVLTLRNVNLLLTPVRGSQQPEYGPGSRRLQGTLSGDFLRHVTVEGFIDPDGLKWAITGSIEGLEISPEMRDAVPAELATRLAPLGSFRGAGKLGFRVDCDPSADSPYRFELSGHLAQGRIDDPRLAHPVTDVQASFRLNNEGVMVENGSASSGPTMLRVKSFHLDGFALGSPMWLDAEIRQLELDPHWRNVLPDVLRDQWDKYLPAGRIHADVKLGYDGRTWMPEVSAQCLDVSFAHQGFRYRLQGATGPVTWKDDVLSLDLTAFSGRRPVRILGEVFHPEPKAAFWLTASGRDLPLDEKAFDALKALPGKTGDVICSLNPQGTVDFSWHVHRDRPGQPAQRELHVTLNGCRMKYEGFRYPLSNIHGKLQMRGTEGMHDDRWVFSDMEGANDTGTVTCSGHLGPSPDGRELVLHLSARNVALEEELRNALPHPNMRKLWDDLRLRGMVDLDDVEIRYVAGWERPTVTFRATPRPERTSMELARFPYRLENLNGSLVYRDGHATIERLRGVHGDALLSTAGECRFFPDGSWRLHLRRFSLDRFCLDRELLPTLPEGLRKFVEEVKPTGPLNLAGTIDVGHSGNPGDPPAWAWDLDVVLYQASLDFGAKLQNVNGGLKLVGAYDGQHFHTLAELDIDSLTWKDLQFTQVRGPVWVDDRRVLLGSVVRPPLDKARRAITAELFGGTVSGSGWVTLGATPEYRLQATLAQADLARGAQELIAGRQNLRGTVFARIDLEGAGRSLNEMRGGGRIELRNADVYELPLMITLLSVLDFREPDRSAFSEAVIDYWLEGGHVYLTNITFSGNAISLEGSGLMEFDSSIALTFRALLGRGERQLAALREFFGQVSEQIMVIHVGGTLQEPVHRREPFPQVNEALRRLQAGMERTTGLPPLFPQAGQGIFNGRRGLLLRR